ncbi:hypothetical protein TTHERM_000310809 (macronuclear) [Tetrahymena thermophila SB210]|uniref:Uncharacterized protein n=1 Tax=Tetrahymena thermophila (strain SB210) TaxID=312017 RepID=W7X9T5_TETTS|nr:hypothetical protein TTHERM_000310809 [Tetrahymena thermophila SB210]EWS73163.1 hypothetical protein TTHERM_000310809 [Tetrahymena thermophila SB210]|eukprot:XP_012654350.1 hypothetical protein TTHERM_000310809 [Tetrahymena thermophila SB210]
MQITILSHQMKELLKQQKYPKMFRQSIFRQVLEVQQYQINKEVLSFYSKVFNNSLQANLMLAQMEIFQSQDLTQHYQYLHIQELLSLQKTCKTINLLQARHLNQRLLKQYILKHKIQSLYLVYSDILQCMIQAIYTIQEFQIYTILNLFRQLRYRFRVMLNGCILVVILKVLQF